VNGAPKRANLESSREEIRNPIFGDFHIRSVELKSKEASVVLDRADRRA
jgi:hypothetical protein